MITRKIIFLAVMILCFSGVKAAETDSIHCIVVDDETGMRIRDVTLRFDNGEVQKTDWSGSFTAKGDFKSVMISCVGYMGRKMMREEIGDTIGLFSNGVRLDEVVVMGVGGNRPNIHFKGIDAMSAKLLRNQQYAQGGFNVLGLVAQGLGSLFGKKRSRKDKVKQILDKY